jgi:spermidine synthase
MSKCDREASTTTSSISTSVISFTSPCFKHSLTVPPSHFDIFSDAFTDKRVEIRIEDGINFVKNSQKGVYDLVIVDSTDPVGPGKGLFTEEFYSDAYDILTPEGIMITQSESPRFNSEVFREIYSCYRSIFGDDRVFCYLAFIPTYPTGMWSFSYCSKGNIHPLRDVNPKKQQELQLNFEMKYYNSDVHTAAFSLPNFVKEMISQPELQNGQSSRLL